MSGPAVPTQPMYFGPRDRRLFGTFHSPTIGSAGGAAVLLCSAYGQEAIRAHRVMRVLAERLARAGHAVLRFDYYGTGDSPGEDLDGDLEGWAGDVIAANCELRVLSGAVHTIWLGMRLGASIALIAARRAPEELARLVLWDPVLDGKRYLEHLRARHVASLMEAFGVPPVPSPVELARDPTCYRDEAIGFALSPLLRHQLTALTVLQTEWPERPRSIVAISDPDDADGRDLAAACAQVPGRIQTVAVHHGTDWTTDLADEGVLVPAAALTQLMRQSNMAP